MSKSIGSRTLFRRKTRKKKAMAQRVRWSFTPNGMRNKREELWDGPVFMPNHLVAGGALSCFRLFAVLRTKHIGRHGLSSAKDCTGYRTINGLRRNGCFIREQEPVFANPISNKMLIVWCSEKFDTLFYWIRAAPRHGQL